MFDFEIKIAHTNEEIRAAQRLRYEVFHLEIDNNKEEPEAEGYDCDKYDSASKHLIVIDKSRNMIIGTYRLLFSDAVGDVGFSSEKIFDIQNIRSIDGVLLELGRSCIHKDYRNAAVINLLWNGIAWQVKERKIKFIFGCSRLNKIDKDSINEAFALIKKKHYADDKFRVFPLSQNVIKDLDENAECENARKTFRSLAPLVKGYLHLGAVVCGRPAINPEFGSIVLFMLLPTEKIATPYKRHFLGSEGRQP